MLASYEGVLTEKISRRIFESVVPGVLAHYDLADLAAACAPRRVTVRNPVNSRGQSMNLDQARSQYNAASNSLTLLVEIRERNLATLFPALSNKP